MGSGVCVCFFVFVFFGLAKRSVIFLCTLFCLNHVLVVLEKKKKRNKENVCICVSQNSFL